MSDPKHPIVGDMSIDATDLKHVDLTTKQILSKIKVRAGFSMAVAALTRLTPEQMQASGINGEEVKRALDLKVQYDRCEELLPPAEKLVELLHETRLEHGHQISIILSEVAAQARRRGDRDPKAAEVLGTIGDLLEYVSAPAIKATKTKAKNDEAEGGQVPIKEDVASVPAVS